MYSNFRGAMRNGDYNLVVAPEEYPGKKYRGRYCSEHTLVWWEHTGTVPGPDECLHHRDENKQHNVFENLELKKKKVHAREHQSAHGRAMVKMVCPSCGGIFERPRGNTSLVNSLQGKLNFCSRRCIGLFGFYRGKSRKKIVKEKDRLKNIVGEYRKPGV